MRSKIHTALIVWVVAAGTATAATPAIVAHRGASRDAPENTLAAIRLGFEQGADFVEVDLRLTADQQIVLMHDAGSKRTGGVDIAVAAQTLAELKMLDVGSFKAAKWAGQRVPTLSEALAAVPPGKGMFLELKTGPEIVPKLAETLAASQVSPEQIVIIAFNFATITAAKRRLPKYRSLWLVSPKQPDKGAPWSPAAESIAAQAQGAVDGLDLKACGAIDSKLMQHLKSAGLPVYVWTVNDLATARRMRDLGVSGITTDRPRWLRDTLTPGD
ncbi:MAG TPA: glycerophosphodiester phosphodiesterase family protein [Pirellulales bacterium]